MLNDLKFENEFKSLEKVLATSKRILITSPGAADGDSIGSQLALRRILLNKCNFEVCIINDEPLPERYLFLPDVEHVYTPETFNASKNSLNFDVGIVVDGGVDRAGRVRELFAKCPHRIFIDHHSVSCEFPYTLRIVNPNAVATTEIVYQISQAPLFKYKVEKDFAQQIYLGLVFDTGFFRHSNTTPESMELGAKLLRTGFDFTRVGERGMLERTYGSLKLLSDTLKESKLTSEGKVIYATITQEMLKKYDATDDDREGIIDHLFLTKGIEVAVLFFELPNGKTKLSMRSQGQVNVAKLARELSQCGGGHVKAAGALFDCGVSEIYLSVLDSLNQLIGRKALC